MKVLLLLCILPVQWVLGQTSTPAAIPNEMASRAIAPGLSASDSDLLKSYFEMLQSESERHRAFLKEYYWTVFGGFAGFAALLSAVIALLTWDTLRKAAKRVDERFETEVKARVQARVAEFEKELRVAEGVSEKLRNQVGALEKSSRERFEKMDAIHSLLIEGRARYVAKLYKEAEPFFTKVLALDPNHVLAMTCYGVCLSRSVPPKYEEALAQLDRAIGIDDKAWLAYYNRACVRFLKNNESLAAEPASTLILEDLKLTFDADPGYREWARGKDADWDKAKSDPRFLKLVNGL